MGGVAPINFRRRRRRRYLPKSRREKEKEARATRQAAAVTRGRKGFKGYAVLLPCRRLPIVGLLGRLSTFRPRR